jgi:hypothetical protein
MAVLPRGDAAMTIALVLLVGVLIGGVASYRFQDRIRKDLAFLQFEHEVIKKELAALARKLAGI